MRPVYAAFFDELTKIAFLGELGHDIGVAGKELVGLGGKALSAMHRYEDPIEVGGLGLLAAPNIDNMIARHRARSAGLAGEHGHVPDEAVDKYRLIKEKYHDPLEAGGLGILAAPLIAKGLMHGR